MGAAQRNSKLDKTEIAWILRHLRKCLQCSVVYPNRQFLGAWIRSQIVIFYISVSRSELSFFKVTILDSDPQYTIRIRIRNTTEKYFFFRSEVHFYH